MQAVTHCLAIYDWDAGAHCMDIFRAVRNFFSEEDYLLADCSLLVSGWPKAKRLDLSDLEQTIRSHDRVKSIEGHFNHQTIGQGYFLISGDDSPAPVIFVRMSRQADVSSLERLVRSLAAFCPLNYGYIFDWVEAHDPAFYALGITHQPAGGDVGAEQADADERWFNERVFRPPMGRRYRDEGMFRDIYKINIINARHLERKIGNCSVSEVIKLNGWGTLEILSNAACLWKTDPRNRDEIAAHFKWAGLLI